ncbi:LysE family transporter [Uliginosibacterium sp. 31-16]|uniref:LysE family translocator n=1 Tax=Uliginosibacterium sp. 31-16 TaxID=3068315 RepID=UPI0027401B24|nr:LysE family transporter [Uliginosibacterium sp. 31-16]MDP5239001.1 LysE family transporter [Uliginosibacterium sp. 31-16]
MSFHALLLVMSIHAVALISPGPDFAVVTRLSIVAGRRTGLWAAAGVAAAIGVYVLICALGLSLVLAALPGLSQLLSVVGALYLGWLGIQCLRSRGQMPEAQTGLAGRRAFVTGFLTNLLNPKAMLYFGSILSQVLTPDLGRADTALLWGLLVSESLLWFGLVACLFSSRPVLDWLRGRLLWFERIIGLVLLGLAAKVASAALR